MWLYLTCDYSIQRGTFPFFFISAVQPHRSNATSPFRIGSQMVRPYEVSALRSTTWGAPSASVRWNLPCIQTRYIFSCRLRFTSSRRSTPSCIMVNRGWANPSASGPPCRDGWITCRDGSGLGLEPEPGRGPLRAADDEESGSRLGGGMAADDDASRPSGKRSSSSSPFSSSTSTSVGSCACCCNCACACAAGGAGEPVNNNANSSAQLQVKKIFFLGETVT